MFADRFFEFIGGMGIAWVFVALAYALFDYIFNILMCSLTGGYAKVGAATGFQAISKSIRTRSTSTLGPELALFSTGARERLKEFRSDSLSWIWPIMVLGLSTFIYGTTRTSIDSSIEQLRAAGLNITAYRLSVFTSSSDRLQYFCWVAATLVSLYTFLRYRRRKTPTWFSKSLSFHLSRTALFNVILAYMIISLALLWLDFSTSLYGLLDNDGLIYPLFYPDLMYGLSPAYRVVTGASLFLLIVSFMPAIMLIRERSEIYSWTYYALVYGAVLIVIFVLGVLVFQFNGRLESIHEVALVDALPMIDRPLNAAVSTSDSSRLLVALEYVNLLRFLPDGFPIPRWLEYILGVRLLLLTYELYLIFSPKSEWPTLSEALRRVTGSLS